ncbi:hypothetical protein ACMD2_12445, partial [Ananas comosus]
MARVILFCVLAADIVTTLATARSFPTVDRTTAIQIDRPMVADPPSSSSSSYAVTSSASFESRPAEGPASFHPHVKHRPFDRSLAGGKIILGGLAAAIFAAVFCYIRITRRKSGEPKANAGEPTMAYAPSSSLNPIELHMTTFAGAPEISLPHHRQHRAFDKSFAGGEVILGGLATAILAAVFCYIRVTRERSSNGLGTANKPLADFLLLRGVGELSTSAPSSFIRKHQENRSRGCIEEIIGSA